MVNPAPCDPDICGILGIPCERCMPEHFEALVAYAEKQEWDRVMAKFDEMEKGHT